MQEHVTSAAQEIAQAASVKPSLMAAAGNSVVAGGVVVTSTKPEVVTENIRLGAYLANNGVGFLSYMEMISVIGAVYLVFKFSTEFYDRFILPYRSKTNGQQTRIKTTIER